MKYTLTYQNPQTHFLSITAEFDCQTESSVRVMLPLWRPGRYELGNFAKNIGRFDVFDESGNSLIYKKNSKSSWCIETGNSKHVKIQYTYYATDLNAGSTYMDSNQLYVNPVNCLVYTEKELTHSCELHLDIPDNFVVAIGLEEVSERTYLATNFHELADSPFIASPSLQHNTYRSESADFHIWIQGEMIPDWEKMIADFKSYTDIQWSMMGSFPFKEYHFLFQFLPTRVYHGVEHQNCTVIALGPDSEIMKGSVYEDLLGVSSHELFHAWNIKCIRPVEMMPYNYARENYSNLGYVAEGVTTYYGDLFLLRSRVFSEQQYLTTFDEQLQKHFDNFGRMNYSVAESSFDTWLDGYDKGIPNRKVSIYTEGCLLAFICDVRIRAHTQNNKSLDDVMRHLYGEFGLKGRGYSEEDYKRILEEKAGMSFDDIYSQLVWGREPYDALLAESLDYLGLKIEETFSLRRNESAWGFKVSDNDLIINAVWPGSRAEQAGLWYDDRIVAVNNVDVSRNATMFYQQMSLVSGGESEILVERRKKILRISLSNDLVNSYYRFYRIVRQNTVTKEQEDAYRSWSGLR